MRRLRQMPFPLHFFVISFLLLYLLSSTILWMVQDDSAPIMRKELYLYLASSSRLSTQSAFVFLSRAPPYYNDNLTKPFCVDWNQNMDEWWSQHPTWELALQNTTHQCFQPISNTQQAQLYQHLHQLQQQKSHNDTTTCRTKIISNSGWGVDVSYIVDGLHYALQHETPVDLKWQGPWQYAPPLCSSQDARCLFLPFSAPPCREQPPEGEQRARYWQTPWSAYSNPQTRWLLQYVTRGQTWLRHQSIQWVDTVALPDSCDLAIHVRRADVILHGAFSRQYHKLREYVQAYLDVMDSDRETTRHVLLLTDDANGIGEALQYTQRTNLPWHWYYFDRPRFRGPEGGWENAIPSQDPAIEVAILYASVHLLQRCAVIVHSKSNLADYYFAFMQMVADDRVRRINLDANRPHNEIHNSLNAETVRYSRAFDV
jgi:hypothetical protein